MPLRGLSNNLSLNMDLVKEYKVKLHQFFSGKRF
jgi:hypothetical protein